MVWGPTERSMGLLWVWLPIIRACKVMLFITCRSRRLSMFTASWWWLMTKSPSLAQVYNPNFVGVFICLTSNMNRLHRYGSYRSGLVAVCHIIIDCGKACKMLTVCYVELCHTAANVNDRSMTGERDSEVAIRFEDKEMVRHISLSLHFPPCSLTSFSVQFSL